MKFFIKSIQSLKYNITVIAKTIAESIHILTTNKLVDTKTIEYIINLSKEEVATVGVNGQKRLLSVRNYERIAADLAHQLNIL